MLRIINKMGNIYVVQNGKDLSLAFYTADNCKLAMSRGIRIEGLYPESEAGMKPFLCVPLLPAYYNKLFIEIQMLGREMTMRGFDLRNAGVSDIYVRTTEQVESSSISEIRRSIDSMRILEFTNGVQASKLSKSKLNPKQESKILQDLRTYTGSVVYISTSSSGIILNGYFVYKNKKLSNIVVFQG